jgi:hypothetical protein
VTVTPDESSSVLIAGMPHACIGVNSAGRYGPVVGQCAAKSGQRCSLLSMSPSRHRVLARVEGSAPKNAAKNITSRKMNQLIAQRKERVHLLVEEAPSLSRITVPNQPNSM